MKEIIKKIAKLIDVKSFVTIAFTILVYVLALKGIITGEQIMMAYTTIIAFYFGTQSQKKASDEDGNTKEINISKSNNSNE